MNKIFKKRGKRNMRNDKCVIKVSNKSIEIKKDNFGYLNKLKAKIQMDNPYQVVIFDDVIGYLRHIEGEKLIK